MMRLSAQWTDGDGIEHFNIHNAIVDGAATIVKWYIRRILIRPMQSNNRFDW